MIRKGKWPSSRLLVYHIDPERQGRRVPVRASFTRVKGGVSLAWTGREGPFLPIPLTGFLIARSAPREPLRLAFAGNAGLDEGVVTGAGQLHRVPLALLTHRVHLELLVVDRHLVDDPCRAAFTTVHCRRLRDFRTTNHTCIVSHNRHCITNGSGSSRRHRVAAAAGPYACRMGS